MCFLNCFRLATLASLVCSLVADELNWQYVLLFVELLAHTDPKVTPPPHFFLIIVTCAHLGVQSLFFSLWLNRHQSRSAVF